MIPAAVTPGVFDGFNIAHRHVVGVLKERARAIGAKAVVLRLAGSIGPDGRLAPATEVQARIVRSGADYCIPLAADSAVAETARWARLFDFRAIVCGEGFDLEGVFGGKESNAFTQATVERVPTVEAAGERVTTARVRALVARGDVESVAALLGRPYALESTVVKGKSVGKRLGFPTANLAPAGLLVPAPGVYAGWSHLRGNRYETAINVPETRHPVEAHLLGLSERMYGASIRVEFVARMREEREFPDNRKLAEQIAEDIEAVRRVLQEREGRA